MPCIYRDGEEGDAVVDFTVFHNLVKVRCLQTLHATA
jgi:hypothetical protein